MENVELFCIELHFCKVTHKKKQSSNNHQYQWLVLYIMHSNLVNVQPYLLYLAVIGKILHNLSTKQY